jgi:hypothetical protein
MRWSAALGLLLIAVQPALAQDFVAAKGKLSDADFYRLVACGRPPGGECRIPLRRWPPDLAADLTVTLLPTIEPVQPALASQIEASLDRAIAILNGVGAAFHLRRVDDNAPALIRVQIRSQQSMSLLSGETKRRLIPGGMVMFAAGPADRITGADIVYSAQLVLTETESVVLEELTQSLGLVFDISGDHYKRRSIFSQERNSVTVITGQDATALRLHYPPRP